MVANCTLPDSGLIYQQLLHDDLSSVPFHPDTSESMLNLVVQMMRRNAAERPTIDAILSEPKIQAALRNRLAAVDGGIAADDITFMSNDESINMMEH